MTTPYLEDEGVLQEWAPESRLLFQIPSKAQRGLFSQDLKLTCVDAVPEFITLGTNCGLVYWYCRQSAELQRLRLENTNCSITCVKIVSTVDFMVAAGTDIGNVTVFQIPKQPPDSLPDAIKPKGKQVERFTIDGLHKAPVTCLEWSQNGMKLFSGDKLGAVVLTAIDFHMHLSKSTELLNEQFEIVQLSYHQQMLLISTIYRAIICDGKCNWRVTQLGTKERKILGKFGATFVKFEHGTVIYASRPGQRLWLADPTGNIEQTLIFKTALQSTHPKIALINPTVRKEAVDSNFGKLFQFGENCLVCYHSEVLYVLHPGAITVVGSLCGARKILDVAVNKDEIFILEGDRCLLRVGHSPDPHAMDDVEDVTNRRKSFILDDFANKIKDSAVGSLKRMASDLMAPVEKVSPPALAAEALDLPPIMSFPVGTVGPLLPDKGVEIHTSIDEPELNASSGAIRKISCVPPVPTPSGSSFQPEEEIIFRPGRRRKQKKINNLLVQAQGTGHESESDSMSTTSEDRLVCGFANEPSVSEESPTSWSQSQSSFSILRDINTLLPQPPKPKPLPETPKSPDDRSQDSLDTCESVSENMAMTPDLFRDEQEKTFIRLANHEFSMLDSFNSERTENMSISVNMTPSSSASSKLSDHLLSSDVSENVSMLSEYNSPPEPLPGVSPKMLQSMDQLPLSAETSSVSSGNSQKNEPSSMENSMTSSRQWNKELILSQMLGLDLQDPLNRRQRESQEKQNEEESKNLEMDKDGYDCATPLVEGGEFTDRNSLLPESDQQPSAGGSSSAPDYAVPEADSGADRKLASLDGLSYGPPSGSSLLSSCHPSLDLNSGLAVLSNPQALAVEKSDRWLQYKTPEELSLLTVSNNYVVCIDKHDQVFYSPLSGISLTWASLDYKATAVAVSPDARLVWIHGQRGVCALVTPSLNGPFSETSQEVASNIRSFAVDKEVGYYVQTGGQIKCQKNLYRSPCGRSEDVPCPWLVTSVACRNGVVLALTNDEILVCKNSTSADFFSVVTPSKTCSAMAMGPGSLVWVVDPHNNIYFSDDFESTQPNWWQVLISEYIFQNSSYLSSSSAFLNMHNRVKMGNLRANIQLKQTLVAANDSSVWVYNKFSSCVHVNKMDFTGYIWDNIPLRSMIKCGMICVEGLFEEKGNVWLLSLQGDLFGSTPALPGSIKSIPSPCASDIVCIASAPDSLWVLTAEGSVHARLGLSEASPTGTAWRELRLPQLTDLRLVWVSCGCDVAWCVDVAGRVFITLVPPHDMATNVFDAAWLEVDGKPKDNASFVKVFVGPHMHMVWALDSKQQMYVREGIFPHYQIGTGWVHVGGIAAVHLSVSSTAVWAMTPSGSVYRRHGISESNYIGDYWRRVPGDVTFLSATFSDELWGICSGVTVARLQQRRVSLEGTAERRNVSLGDTDDWLVVE